MRIWSRVLTSIEGVGIALDAIRANKVRAALTILGVAVGVFVVVGMGAEFQEWFCLDLNEASDDGEFPIVLFDARDNALDQKFYDSFGQMLDEVLGFVEQNLDGDLSRD